MPIKLIASDLDGTLMAPDHLTVTPETVRALEQAHKKGVKISIATGRPLSLTDYVIEQLPFVDYIISSNGACVFERETGRLIYSKLISNSISKKIITYFSGQKIFFDIYINGRSCYMNGCRKHIADIDFPGGFMDKIAQTMDGFDSLDTALGSGGIEKVNIYLCGEECKAEYSRVLGDMGLEVSTSFKGGLEATAPGVSKAAAVIALCRELGITAEDVMAFGDEGNDARLMRFAGFSFAMENASGECKAAAKFLTKSNGENGVACAVEKFVLNIG